MKKEILLFIFAICKYYSFNIAIYKLNNNLYRIKSYYKDERSDEKEERMKYYYYYYYLVGYIIDYILKYC